MVHELVISIRNYLYLFVFIFTEPRPVTDCTLCNDPSILRTQHIPIKSCPHFAHKKHALQIQYRVRLHRGNAYLSWLAADLALDRCRVAFFATWSYSISPASMSRIKSSTAMVATLVLPSLTARSSLTLIRSYTMFLLTFRIFATCGTVRNSQWSGGLLLPQLGFVRSLHSCSMHLLQKV